MKPYKIVEKVKFQMFYIAEGDGTVLEFLNDKDEVFMEIGINEDDTHQFVVCSSKEHISIPLSELMKGIEIAKQRVVNVRLQEGSQ